MSPILAALPLIFLSGCFNVDKTQRVELSGSELHTSGPSKEELVMKDIIIEDASEWEIGRIFYAVDDRAALAFDSRTLPSDPLSLHLDGEALIFQGVNYTTNAVGQREAILKFTSQGKEYLYPTGKTSESERSLPLNTELPMLVDSQVLLSLNSQLKGKDAWTLSSLWYGREDEVIKGYKYKKVEIDSVTRGHRGFPIKIWFHTTCHEDYTGNTPTGMYLTFGAAGADSRSFPTQFSLTDPKLRHPGITSEIWALIQQGEVREGMTKEECRLALGSPADVMTGSNPGYYYDLWQYPDGRYLMFQDGILVQRKP